MFFSYINAQWQIPQCHAAASCSYHVPSSLSCSTTEQEPCNKHKKCNYLLIFCFLSIGEFSGEKSGQGNDTKEEATGLGRRKRNQISPEIPDRR